MQQFRNVVTGFGVKRRYEVKDSNNRVYGRFITQSEVLEATKLLNKRAFAWRLAKVHRDRELLDKMRIK